MLKTCSPYVDCTDLIEAKDAARASGQHHSTGHFTMELFHEYMYAGQSNLSFARLIVSVNQLWKIIKTAIVEKYSG